MKPNSGKLLKLVALIVVGAVIYAFFGGKKFSEHDFIGKWQSSRTLTPLILADNGEWEIRTAEGSILQYGIWRYENKKLIWTVKQGGRITDDVNPVLSVGANEFMLREENGSTTLFTRIK